MITHKKYVGFSSNYEERWKTHIKEANGLDITRKILHLSIRKYGLDNFKFEVIYCSKDKDHTKNKMEAFFIKEYITLAPNGYNMTKGGDGGHGVTSEQATIFNQKIIKDGSHLFLDKEFHKTVKLRMTKNNPMSRPEVKAKQAKSNSYTQKLKVLSGTHYLQSEEHRHRHIKRMAIMSSRPLLKEVRELFKKRLMDQRPDPYTQLLMTNY